jgi:hypothetical protein
MNSLMETLLPVWVTIFALLFVFNFLYMRKVAVFFKYLREKQPSIWEELGKPTLFWNNSPGNQMKVLAYLKDKKYESSGDPDMIRLCRTMRGMLTLSMFGFTILFLGFIVMFADAAMHHK